MVFKDSTGVALTSSSFDKGKVHCEYEVSTKLTVTGVTIPNGQVTDYDLTQPFHLLLAAGPLRKDTAGGLQNAKAWHGRDRRTASTKTFVLGGHKTVYNHCEGTRTCYGVPNNCVATKSCQQLLTYGLLAEGETSISMTLYGMPPNEESGVKGYWIGFGTSSHGKMVSVEGIVLITYNSIGRPADKRRRLLSKVARRPGQLQLKCAPLGRTLLYDAFAGLRATLELVSI